MCAPNKTKKGNKAFSCLFCTHLAITVSAVVSRRLGAMSRMHVFTALYGMQTRSTDEKSVCLSVCHMRILRQNGRKISLDLYTLQKIIQPSFLRSRMVGATPSTWNFGSANPRWSKIVGFRPIFARSSSAVTPSEKSSINTNRTSTTRFPMSLRWSSYVAPKPPKGSQKRKTADFRVKSHFAWRQSATKFLCMKTVSGRVVRHSMA